MPTSLYLHMKSRRICIKTRSPPASLPLKGQITKHTTVKWTILLLTIKSEKQTTHQVSCKFLLIMVTFLRACDQARIISRVILRFPSSFSNRSVIELMEQEPRHLTLLFSFACKVRLMSSSCRCIFPVFHGEKLTLRRALITVPVGDVFC